MRGLPVLGGLATAVVLVATAAPAVARPAADYEMPFPCRQAWTGDTRADHSPSSRAIDWNRPDDLGDPVVAAESGIVTRAENLGSRSYGIYVVIDHGDGESTLYAHMAAEFVTVGQTVDRGEVIGLVGSSGGSTGPHLHFEERLNGQDQPPWFNGEPFPMNTTATSRNCVDTPLAGDWNGDGVAQIGLFRRGGTSKFRLAWGPDVRVVPFGNPADTPLVGDWNGDGVSDQGVRHYGASTFLLRNPDGSTTSIDYGVASDRAVAGDWNGDGRWQVGVWRPSTRTFYLRTARGNTRTVALGTTGSIPVTGDWNGDGRTDVGVFHEGTWTLKVQGAATGDWSGSVSFGTAGDLPLTGDWNGDGATDLGTWTPSTATFRLRKAAPAVRATTSASVLTRQWGRPR